MPSKITSHQKNNWAIIIGIAGSIVVSFIIAVILIFLFSRQPLVTMRYYFLGPFMDRFTFFNMLESSIPLIFSGLGIAIAFKSGVTNLGGEGQIFSGAIVAVIVGTTMTGLPRPVGIVLLLAAGAAAGAALAGLSGLLRMKFRISDLLTSYLISSGMVYVINYLILGPFRDPGKVTIQSISIPSKYMLLRFLPPSYIHTGIFLALAMAALIFFILNTTHFGYELRVTGSNPQFARYAGINTANYTVYPMLLSGGLIGLGGALQVVGRYRSCYTDLTAGLGWNGIAVALIARNNPLGVIPAALLYAYLAAGARVAMINSDVTVELAAVISSVIFYLVTAEAAFAFIRRRLGE
ncbi:MAG: ABC transporter permease [Rectinemataceae bacterium]|nr:ABC transporter permease [Rectinemataceae bacterium]